MLLHVYDKTTNTLLFTKETERYDADKIYLDDGEVSFAGDSEYIEFSLLPDLSQTLRAGWRAKNPSDSERIRDLEAILAELLFGGEL